MSEQLLTIFKLCLLALLYLFFFRVLRAVWAELHATPATAGGPAAASAPASSPAASRPRRARGAPSQLVAVEGGDRVGATFTVSGELTIGRAGGCQISLPDDTYVSSLHARVFHRDGDLYVEDLGSTNGTYLNGAKVGSATKLKRGDRLHVGGTVLEAR